VRNEGVGVWMVVVAVKRVRCGFGKSAVCNIVVLGEV